jgi:hypothetical protein
MENNKVNNQDANISTSTPWDDLAKSAPWQQSAGGFRDLAEPDQETVREEQSKRLFKAANDHLNLDSSNWDKLNISQQAQIIAGQIRNANTLISEAKKQATGKPHDIAFTEDQINKMRKFGIAIAKILVSNGLNKEDILKRSADSSTADVLYDEFANGRLPNTSVQDLHDVMLAYSTSTIRELNIDERTKHSGTKRISKDNGILSDMIIREENCVRLLQLTDS